MTQVSRAVSTQALEALDADPHFITNTCKCRPVVKTLKRWAKRELEAMEIAAEKGEEVKASDVMDVDVVLLTPIDLPSTNSELPAL